MAAKTTNRGLCPACDREFGLTKKGVLRHHLEKPIIGRQFSPPCQGVGERPADRTTEK